MTEVKNIYLVLACFIIAAPSRATAGVDPESVFSEARRPASELDLELSSAEENLWRAFFGTSDDPLKTIYPQIAQAGVKIDLRYNGGDHINATGLISNLKGFLKLSAGERKKLVLDAVSLIRATLQLKIATVDKRTGVGTGATLDSRHIQLSVMIYNKYKDETGVDIDVPYGPDPFLPLDIGIGRAGFINGQFVFSEPYFLNLTIQGGMAKHNGPDKFIIESENEVF